jgi:hypothetical protein
MKSMPEDDSAITEITILPDGRICLFGASQQVLETLDAVVQGDPALKHRVDCLREAAARQPDERAAVGRAPSDTSVTHRVEQ